MDDQRIIERLSANAALFENLLGGVTESHARWKPAAEKWSILEVVNHLYDEEREDFRLRLDMLLRKSKEPWPGIDPEGWVKERGYGTRNLKESLEHFLAERTESIQWLRGLESPNWNRIYSHPILGEIQAGDLLASWLAHDFLHLRQLSGLLVSAAGRMADPYSIRYATPFE